MNNQVKQRIKSIQETLEKYITKHTPLSKYDRLDKFSFSRWAIPYIRNPKSGTNMPIMSHAIDYSSKCLDGNMEWPIFHIFGKSGTGKSHFAKGLCRYLILNKFNLVGGGCMMPFSYVDWPMFISSTLDKKTLNIDWKAKLMLIENIDSKAPIFGKTGNTMYLDLLLSPLKERVEVHKLPTIIVTRRNSSEMERFLATDYTGKVIKHATETSKAIADTIGYTIYKGVTYGNDFRSHITKSPQNLASHQKTLKEQDMSTFFAGKYDIPTRW